MEKNNVYVDECHFAYMCRLEGRVEALLALLDDDDSTFIDKKTVKALLVEEK